MVILYVTIHTFFHTLYFLRSENDGTLIMTYWTITHNMNRITQTLQDYNTLAHDDVIKWKHFPL